MVLSRCDVRAAVVLALAAVATGAGCTSETPAQSCPNDLPSGCPATPPSYAHDVAPVIERRCYPCHGPGGAQSALHDFSRYDVVHTQRRTVLNEVYACVMPPRDAAAPTSDERKTLLTWLTCGAPDN